MNNKQEFLQQICHSWAIHIHDLQYIQHTVNLLNSRADDIFFSTEFHQLLSHGIPIRVSEGKSKFDILLRQHQANVKLGVHHEVSGKKIHIFVCHPSDLR